MFEWINRKTGIYYIIEGFVHNATNAQDGQEMVLYKNFQGQLFAREINEFNEKFIKAE